MSNPVSAPVIPVQPGSASYPPSALSLFQTYTRESYLTAFGVQAPPWDPSRVIKTWFDSTADTSRPVNVSVYKAPGPDAAGTWGLQQMVLPASEAATVNLPGAISYPSYTIAPTTTTVGGTGINPMFLSLESDAKALLAQVGGSALVDEALSPAFAVVYPADEPRRVWAIVLNGAEYNVGLMLNQQNSNGIGYPGRWDVSKGPEWIPDPPAATGIGDTRPPRPMPVRELLPNEQIRVGLMGVTIVRTDLELAQEQADGRFLADDRATLQRIYQMVSKLAS